MKKYTRKNLIRVNTYVSEYLIENEKLNKEFNINEISLETLKTIFNSEPHDDELFLSYSINEVQAEILNKNLLSPILFKFESFEYFIERYGEYKEQ